MATSLHAILNAFETGHAQSLGQLSQQLDIAPPMLESMLVYWVRKGRLREVNGVAQDTGCHCASCGSTESCPYIMKMPRLYELVREGESIRTDSGCACGAAGKHSCCH